MTDSFARLLEFFTRIFRRETRLSHKKRSSWGLSGKLLSILLFRRPNRIKLSDEGIFDPFVPIGNLKPLDRKFQDASDILIETEPLYDQPERRPGYWILRICIILGAIGLFVRLVGLQVTMGAENRSLAEGNRLRSELISPPRGLIYDRSGTPLVRNVPSFSVIIRPTDLPKKGDDRKNYLTSLAQALGRDQSEIQTLLERDLNKETITIEDGLDRDRAMVLEIRLNNLAGVSVIKSPNRQYVQLASLGHLVGYLGKADSQDLKNRPELSPSSIIGKAGLESYYDQELQGTPGVETLEVDSLGRTIRSIGTKPAVAGDSLLLSIDSGLQTQTAESLKKEVEITKAKSAAAVVMDVKTGEVLAMVSLPDFDNNIFSFSADEAKRSAVLTDPSSPMINRAVAGLYPSGSTIKPVVAAAALNEKTISADTKLDTSEGKITVGQSIFPDSVVHGITDVRQAIAESNNIFFFALGGGYKNVPGLGVNRLADYLGRFGFGKKTGIDLSDEASGLVPNPDWKESYKNESWYLGDTYNLSIGQGDLLVTPLQMANAVATIANGGKLLKPKLLKSIIPPNDQASQPTETTVLSENTASADVLRIVREGMRKTVEWSGGSGHSLSTLPIKIAGKTGTAQFTQSKDKTHSWFTAFAPYDDPQIALAVIVEGGGEGYKVSIPIARTILEKYFNLPITPIVAPSPTPAPSPKP